MEELVGDRYRREVSDKGLGLTRDSMQKNLERWGYDAGRGACQEWLKKYRMGHENAVDGSAGVYVLSRQCLMRWHHVDGLGPEALQKRHLEEHGAHAQRAHLVSCLQAPAQKLVAFENNEDVHSHACGEYVLKQLQNGVKPEVERVSCGNHSRSSLGISILSGAERSLLEHRQA